MRRREFIALTGFVAAAWPLVARAQQPAMPVIGFLSSRSLDTDAQLLTIFREGLNQTGYVEGRNVAVEYRGAEGQYDRLPTLAAELVRKQVAVISASAFPAALAAKAATSTIPIVFEIGNDPVKSGLVASLNRPGGNVTGVTLFTSMLGSKQLALLHELLPRVPVIAVLVNPTNPNVRDATHDVQTAAHTIGLETRLLNASGEQDLHTAFSTIAEKRIGGLLVPQRDPFFTLQRERLAGLAIRYGVPMMCSQREFAMAGGLISYSSNPADAWRQAGVYTGRVLDGATPKVLPVQLVSKFQLVVNLKTAKALGLTVPPSVLAIADEVIE
jgi:putative tryptophan/tyrosine transport system substrate-binding protein